jgi:dihydroflavonol-4-reductase
VRDRPLELSVINPGLILGPLLGEGHASSVHVVRRLLAGKFVGLPRVGWAVVDVRDVAEAHVRAMLLPEARGLRFCCAGEHAWLSDMAHILAQHYESRGYRVPRRVLPDWLVRALSLVDHSARLVVHKLGQRVNVSSERAKNLLGLAFRPLEESVLATAESLIAHAAV